MFTAAFFTKKAAMFSITRARKAARFFDRRSLDASPFNQFSELITHKQAYMHAQRLGRDMRDAGVTALCYPSARDTENQLCIGLFTPNDFTSNQPDISGDWICQTEFDKVVFKQHAHSEVAVFTRQQFLYEGCLPHPA